MKVSTLMVTDIPSLPAGSDPHADASRIPRFSSPLSFLSKRAFLAVAALLSFAAVGQTTAQQVSTTCVCNYDANKDYFPLKLTRDFATQYNIEYNKSYKKITVKTSSTVEVTIYAYLCGTPIPAEATADNAIQIPIDSSILTSTTQYPYIAYLGKQLSINYMPVADAMLLNACGQKLVSEGKLSVSNSNSTILTISNTRTGEAPDVYFSGTAYDDAVTAVRASYGNHTKVVPIVETREKTPLGILEWTEVMAALYNAEPAARYVVDSIRSRYECVKAMVADMNFATKPKVIWGYAYNGLFSSGSCPNYYCAFIKDAGGEMIFPANTSVAAMIEAANLADVIIYTDVNFRAPSVTGNPAYPPVAKDADFDATNVFTTQQIYDIQGAHKNDWFENRPAQPDVFLMDLVQAFHGSEAISATRKLRFLRNVFTEPAFTGIRDAGVTCTDETAPLYSDWLDGPCNASALGQANTGYIEPILCTAPPSLAPTTADSNTAPTSGATAAAATSMVFIMMVFATINLAF